MKRLKGKGRVKGLRRKRMGKIVCLDPLKALPGEFFPGLRQHIAGEVDSGDRRLRKPAVDGLQLQPGTAADVQQGFQSIVEEVRDMGVQLSPVPQVDFLVAGQTLGEKRGHFLRLCLLLGVNPLLQFAEIGRRLLRSPDFIFQHMPLPSPSFCQ